jgi:hypothetical protein
MRALLKACQGATVVALFAAYLGACFYGQAARQSGNSEAADAGVAASLALFGLLMAASAIAGALDQPREEVGQ